ncbi:MAG: phosphatidylserine/phosphatidylglycerophosphate/cardiolipin synthase family protein [Sphaerochaetaceae bacterium]|jgi:cardiolipin synthase
MKKLAVFFCVVFLCGCASTKTMLEPPYSDPSVSVEQKLEEIGLTKTPITDPKVYYDGNAWMERVKTLVSNAKKYVILTSFLASDSDECKDLYHVIVDKANEGVPVYFLVDGIGLFDMTESRFHLVPLTYLNDTPVHFMEFSPMSTARFVSLGNMLYRYHQKVVIIDGETMAIGGMNLNYISVGAKGKDLQRDSMYEFHSPQAIKEFVSWFIDWWNSNSWDRIAPDAFPVDMEYDKNKQWQDAWFVNQIPGHDTLAETYGALIASAKESVEILPFLPALDGNMKKAISDAIARGVKVSMVISYDPRTADRWMYLPLLEMGVQMRLETGKSDLGLLHEKLMVVDGRYVVFGSSNFNYRSMTLSYESAMVLSDMTVAANIQQHFQTLFDNATTVSLDEARKWQTVDKYLMHLIMTVGG